VHTPAQANWVHMPISTPCDTIVIRMTTSGDSLGTVVKGARAEPFSNLYKGVIAFLVITRWPLSFPLKLRRNCEIYPLFCLTTQQDSLEQVLGAKNAVQFAVYEPTKRWQIARNLGGALTPAQAFFHGAFSRLISDAVLFPARRAKVLQQKAKKDGSNSDAASKSLVGVLAQVAKEKGLMEVFNGLGPELVRGMISGALMLMVKEYIDAIVIGAILGRAAVA